MNNFRYMYMKINVYYLPLIANSYGAACSKLAEDFILVFVLT